jgi:hypothetical protein
VLFLSLLLFSVSVNCPVILSCDLPVTQSRIVIARDMFQPDEDARLHLHKRSLVSRDPQGSPSQHRVLASGPPVEL